MKNIILIIIVLTLSLMSRGQTLTPEAISSGGNFLSQGAVSLSSTLGEGIIETGSGTTLTLTQGFQQVPQITLNITAQTNVTCFGGNDGSLTATVLDGFANYTYEWSNGASTAGTSATSNTISGLVEGSYTVTVTDATLATATASATVTEPPQLVVIFTALDDLCLDAGVQAGLGGGSPTGGVYSGPGVTDDVNGTTYSFDPASAGIGTHTLIYTYTDGTGCTNSASDNIEVFALPIVTFTALADICVDAGVQSGLGGGSPTGGIFSGPGVTDDANGMTYSFDPVAAGVGTHTITYTYTDGNGCTGSATDDVEVFALPNVTFTALADLCVDAGVQAGLGTGVPMGGVYSGPGVTDDGNGTTYSFDPAAAGVGVHTLTYVFTDANGCTNSASDDIEVFTLPTVTFTALADLCLDAGVQAGLGGGSPTGGVYSGPGVTDDGTGFTYSFDPAAAGAGVHTLTYTFVDGNGCTGSASDDVEVFALPNVGFTAPADLCVDAGVQTGLGGGTHISAPVAGMYSGPGVTDDGNGSTYSFDPAAAGVGTHSLTYTFTDGNGCTNSASDDVEVFALPTVTFTALADLCVDAGVQAGLGTGVPMGGVYSGPGVTDDGNGTTYSFDPAAAGVGVHTLTYVFTDANGCTNSASDYTEVFTLPTVTFTALADLCIDAAVQAGLGGGSPTGGVYSGPGVTDDGTGFTYSFDPAAAGAGTHTLIYTFVDANGCSNSASDDVEVFALPTVTFTALADLCVDAGVQTGLGGGTHTPVGSSIYSGPGVTDDGNGSTYSFDPAAAGIGTHTIIYTYTDGNGCTNSDSDDVEVFALPTPTFTALADICVDAGVQVGLGGGSPTGGVYSGPGVSDDGNGTTYSFDPAAAGVGVHTLAYNYTDANGCTNSASDLVEVFALPIPTFTALADLCIDAGVQAGLGSGVPTGGVYSGPGVTDDGNGTTYSFDPAAAGAGTLTLTYTFVDGNGCTNSASDDVEVFALPIVTFTALADVCVDAGVQAGLGSGSPVGGIYSGPGVTDDGNGQTYSFDPSLAGAGVGVHAITYTFTDGNSCTNSFLDDVEVFALPVVTFTAPADLCIDAGQQISLGGGTPTGGVYSGSGVTDNGNGQTYSFDPAAAGVGTHTLTYTYTDGNGCTNDASSSIEVFDLANVYAGADASICESGYQLNPTVDFEDIVTWTTYGDGSFDDPSDESTFYTPGTNDIANGSVILELVATPVNNPPCVNLTSSQVTLTIIQDLPYVNIGGDITICEGDVLPFTPTVTNASTVLWTTIGDGTFNNANTMNATYTPGAGDIALGSVLIKLDAAPMAPCTDITGDQITVTINPPVTASAGADASICPTGTYALNDATATNYTSLVWTGGDGSFDDATMMNPTYTPGPLDIVAGSVQLCLTANPMAPCPTIAPVCMTLNIIETTLSCPPNATEDRCQDQAAIDVAFATWLGTVTSSNGFSTGSCDLSGSTPDNALSNDTWNRPFASGTCCSGLGPVSYSVYGPFTVSVTGSYNIGSVQNGWDGYLFVYENAFDPQDQTANYLGGDDDGNGGIGTSDIEGVILAVGNDYYIVTTGFAAGDFGSFTNTITGPGTYNCGTSTATNDNSGAPLATGGSTTVTWSITDWCQNVMTCSATFTVENYVEPAVIFASNATNAPGQFYSAAQLEFCYDQTIDITLDQVLTGTGPFTIEWTENGNAMGPVTIIQGQSLFTGTKAVGTYNVLITKIADSYGCEPADYTPYNAAFTVNPEPQADILINGTTVGWNYSEAFCGDEVMSFALGANMVTGNYDLQSIAWDVTFNGGASALSGSATNVGAGFNFNFTPTTLAAGTYVFSLTELTDANGCSPSTYTPYEATIEIKPMPTITSVDPSDAEVCDGEAVSFSASGLLDGVSIFSYTIDDGVNPTFTGTETVTAAGGTYMFAAAVYPVGTYTVYINSIEVDGCTSQFGNTVMTSFTVNPLPVVTCPANMEVCEDADAVWLEFQGAVPQGGVFSGQGVVPVPGCTGCFDFEPWTAGVGVHTITYMYTDPVTTCVNSCTFDIEVYPLPVVSCPPDMDVCENDAPFALSGGSPVLGVYSGTSGVSLGLFDASTASIGANAITYTYTDPVTGCDDVCTFTITVHEQPVVTDAPMISSEDGTTWTTLYGDFSTGFNLCTDGESTTHYALNISGLTANETLATGVMNEFYLDITSVGTDFYTYWAARGVVTGATGWQGVMWDIINGNAPITYLVFDGTDYMLIDGLQYQNTPSQTVPLVIPGDYPQYNYGFTGTVESDWGCVSDPFSIFLRTVKPELYLSTDPSLTIVNDEVFLMYPVSMDIWANVPNQVNPTYLWDYNAETNPFISINDFGTYNVTVTDMGCEVTGSLTVNEKQDIQLRQGWGIFSTYINTAASFDALLADLVAGNNLVVKDENGNAFISYNGAYSNGLPSHTMGEGYQYYMSTPNQLLTVVGGAIDPGTTTLSLDLGYNFIGYLRRTSAPVVQLMAPIASLIDIMKNEDGQVYWYVPSLGIWINQIGDLWPGKGYQLKLLAATPYTFPANPVPFSKSDIYVAEPSYFAAPVSTGNNMTLGIPENAWSMAINVGDEVGVFNQNGDLVGSGVYDNDNMAISLWGDNETTNQTNALADKEIFTLQKWNSLSGLTETLVVTEWIEGNGTYGENDIAIVGKLAVVAESGLSLNNYPNPFKDVTTIEFSIPEDGKVRVELFNSNGKRLQLITDREYTAGIHEVQFSATKLAVGTYFIKLESNGQTLNKAVQVVR